jgi:hypothetical protein
VLFVKPAKELILEALKFPDIFTRTGDRQWLYLPAACSVLDDELDVLVIDIICIGMNQSETGITQKSNAMQTYCTPIPGSRSEGVGLRISCHETCEAYAGEGRMMSRLVAGVAWEGLVIQRGKAPLITVFSLRWGTDLWCNE